MDDFIGRCPLLLRVERGFECSRLENDLLASAYEHVVPILRRCLSDVCWNDRPLTCEKSSSHLQQPIAKGA
jgi:hypothetical protein